MSGLIVGLVMRHPVTKEFAGETKFVAMIYAEHAWPDGSHAYPGIDTVAGIIGCSQRSVQRHVRTLERIGMLILDGKGPRGTNRYKFPLVSSADGSEKLELKPIEQPEEPEKQAENGGDKLSPRQIVTGGGDTDSGDTDSGDTGVTRINKPLLILNDNDKGARPNIFGLYEQNIGAITPLLADGLIDAEKTYPAEWIIEAFRIAVENNARNWKYVKTVLMNIQAHGVGWKPAGAGRGKPNGQSHAANTKPLAEPTDADMAAARAILAAREGVPV